MSYTSRNPQHASVVLDDIVATTPANPPASKHKLIDRDGGLYLRNSAGIERRLAYGEAEINYIKNPNTATGWSTSDGAKLTVTTTTTAAELPREFTTPSAIKILSVASADSTAAYVYYDFNLDDVDLNKLCKISFDIKQLAGYVASDMSVDIVSQADRTTVLVTPSVTLIPAVDGNFSVNWLSDSTAAISLRFKSLTNMADNAGLIISNVIVGPGQLVQGAPVGDWTSFTPTITASGGGSVSIGTGGGATAVGYYRRVGDSAEVTIDWLFGSSGAAFGSSGTYYFGLPGSLVLDTAKVTGREIFGNGVVWDSNVDDPYGFYVGHDAAGHVVAVVETGTSILNVGTTTPFTMAAGDFIRLRFTVPIAGWSSNIYLGSGADSTSVLNWTAATTNPVLSYGGTAATNVSSTTCKVRRVGDSLDFNVKFVFNGAANANGTMTVTVPNGLTMDSGKYIGGDANPQFATIATNSKVYSGVARINGTTSWYIQRAADAGQTGVWSGNTSAGSNVPSAAALANNDVLELNITGVPIVGWTSADYLGKMLTGFSSAIVGRSGLVNNDAANTAGTPIKGRTDGAAPSAGYVGEEKKDETSGAVTTSGISSVGVVTLTTGIWLVTLNGVLAAAASLTGATCKLMVKGVDGTVRGKDTQDIIANSAVGGIFSFPAIVVNVASGDADKTVRGRVQTVGANTTAYTYISAVRIA